MQSIFRVLVSISLVLTVLFWTMPYIDYMWYTSEQLAVLDQSGLGASIVTGEIFYWFQLALWILASVGLLLFIPFARTGFVALYIVLTPLTFFYGIEVLTPIEYFLSSMLGLADGAIIAIMYFTSVSERFLGSS